MEGVCPALFAFPPAATIAPGRKPNGRQAKCEGVFPVTPVLVHALALMPGRKTQQGVVVGERASFVLLVFAPTCAPMRRRNNVGGKRKSARYFALLVSELAPPHACTHAKRKVIGSSKGNVWYYSSLPRPQHLCQGVAPKRRQAAGARICFIVLVFVAAPAPTPGRKSSEREADGEQGCVM